MIRIRELRLEASPGAGPAPQTLLEIPALDIRKGEWISVVGPNGAGKSLLLQLLAGLRKPTSGEITFEQTTAYASGLLFQNPEDQLVGSTVERDLAFGLENRAVPPSEIRRRVDEALARGGLESLARRPPHLLSEGEKQRVAFESTLVLEPVVLLLDEPGARLDPAGRQRVQERLVAERARGDRTLVQVSHRSEEIVSSDRVLGLAQGRIVFDGTPAELMRSAEAHGLGILWSSAATGDPAPSPILPPVAARSDLVRMQGIAWRASDVGDGERVVLDGVDLRVGTGESLGLFGRSGAGKTILATVLAELSPPSAGTIEWPNEAPPSAGRRRSRAALAFQEPERGFFEETVLADVAFGPRNLGLSEEAAMRRAADALRKTGLDPDVFGARDPLTRSGGEARRAALAGIMAMESRLVILDEPTTGLDADGWARLRDLLAALRRDGVATLLVSHEMALLATECERVAVLEAGRIACSDSPAKIAAMFAPDRPRSAIGGADVALPV